MKKLTCILLVFAMATAFFACTQKAKNSAESETAETTAPTSGFLDYSVDYEDYNHLTQTVIDNDSEVSQYLYVCSVPTLKPKEEVTKPAFVVPEGITGSQLIHWPMIPVIGTEPFQVAACTEMSKNPKFDGAKIIKDQYLQLGEIGGEPCVRVHLDTDKGDFVAVMTEKCEILFTWTEGEAKTVAYYFPQAWELNVAAKEDVMQAFHIYHEDEHYKNGIICEYRQETVALTDGTPIWKVTFITTTGDFTVSIDEFGRVVSRTK